MPQNALAFSAIAATPEAEKPVYEPTTVVRHIAHELRQPLSTIESIAFYLEMVLPRTEGKARRQLSRLQEEVHQINWILADAIHFLRAAPLHLEMFDLSEVVMKTVSEWDSQGGPGVCLRLDAGLPLVSLDLEQTQHMLRNIVSFFARASTGMNATVLHTYASDQQVMLEATVTVPNTCAVDLEPLFAPFDSRLPGGSGLGLASVRRIAEAHGAHLYARSGTDDTLALTVRFPLQGTSRRTNSTSAGSP